ELVEQRQRLLPCGDQALVLGIELPHPRLGLERVGRGLGRHLAQFARSRGGRVDVHQALLPSSSRPDAALSAASSISLRSSSGVASRSVGAPRLTETVAPLSGPGVGGTTNPVPVSREEPSWPVAEPSCPGTRTSRPASRPSCPGVRSS